MRELLAWIERTFQALDDWSNEVQLSRLGAYGGMRLDAPPASTADIVLTFHTVDDYDQATAGQSMIFDDATGFFTILEPGAYQINFTAAISHDEVNNSREMRLRIFNETTSVAGEFQVYGTGRNQAVTNVAFQALLIITSATAGQVFAIEIGGATGLPTNEYGTVAFETLALNVFRIGEFV